MITGGAGFIGSHVTKFIVKKYSNVNVTNLDSLEYCSSLKNIEELNKYPNYKFVQGSICSFDLVRHIIVSENIDTIIHFAAQTHVDNSFGNSFTFTNVNVYGTHVLLEVAYRCGIKRFIHVSTDEVYGENEGDHYREDVVLEPTNPYSATKASAELIAKSYLRSFNLPVIITRSNNVYGPHQFPEKLIPKFICRLTRNEPCCIHGDGLNLRSYIYVDDVVDAFDIILHNGDIGEIYNIGVSLEKTNLQVAKDLQEILGKDGDNYIVFVDDRKYNDKRYAINSQKLHSLGWQPKTEWHCGLIKTIKWYQLKIGRAHV